MACRFEVRTWHIDCDQKHALIKTIHGCWHCSYSPCRSVYDMSTCPDPVHTSHGCGLLRVLLQSGQTATVLRNALGSQMAWSRSFAVGGVEHKARDPLCHTGLQAISPSDVAAWKVPEPPILQDRPFRLEEIPGTGQRDARGLVGLEGGWAEFEEAAASVLWPRRTCCRDLDEARRNLSQAKASNCSAAGRAMWCCSNAPSWRFEVMRRARSLQYLTPLYFCSFLPFAVQASLVPTSRSHVTALR